ncbi:MAG: ferrous iron transport protein B [Bacteroidales bacterium]|nr:ferrous iron transport protein B [Bacteroidales bacterium]
MATLYDLNQGDKAIILKLKARGAFRRRLMEMGFISGQEVSVVKKAPLKDPVEYCIMGYNVSLRNEEAKHIEVITSEFYDKPESQKNGGSLVSENENKFKTLKGLDINVVLVGNPNAGKTTLFNYASGSRERVGNYSGVTVSAKEGTFKYKGYQFHIIDLPGTYSITAYSPEEVFVRDYITDHHPDVVVNVIDASNLERNLFLTTQLIDMDLKVVCALNMYDELEQKKDELNHEALGKLLGIPFVPTVSSKNVGINELFDKIIEVYNDKEEIIRHIHINYGEYLENSINKICNAIKIPENFDLTNHISSRFLSIKLLENDKDIIKKTTAAVNQDEILKIAEKEREKIRKLYNEDIEDTITKAKYGFIAGALKETLKKGTLKRKSRGEFFDWLFTNRYLGFPIFIFFMWLMFMLTFKLGAYPMAWIENGFDLLASFLSDLLPAGALTDLLINGILSGVGGVLVFLPNILLLFFFISLMEDTGYMSRAVFIMDKIMHKIGLHGKSFIPLIMGFGCNVPAIMATRTIENKNDRLLTMLINPFMSCSARLPVYVLFISAFFPKNSGHILFAMYVIGVFVAVLVALIFKRILFKRDDVPFVMELSPFRFPTSRSIVRGMWGKAAEYLKKIAGIILIASIIIWGLSNYPVKKEFNTDYKNMTSVLETEIEKAKERTDISADEINIVVSEKTEQLTELERNLRAEMQEYSLLGRIGHFIEPAIRPLGFDWKMGIAILSGAPAKEIIVGTMGVLYHGDADDETNVSLITKLQGQKYTTGPEVGKPIFTPLVAFTFMIFVLLYFPCIGTLIVISRESGSWKWGAFAAIYPTVLAWLIAFAIFQIGSLL